MSEEIEDRESAGPPARTLRRTVGVMTMAVAAGALLVCAALILFAAELHRSTRALDDSVESIRQVEEAEIALLLHARAQDRVVLGALAGELEHRLAEAARFADSAEENRLLVDASRKTRAYIQAAERTPSSPELTAAMLEDAHHALKSLVSVNMAHARSARENADHWDGAAIVIAAAIAALVMLATGMLLWWVRTRAVRPVLALVAAIDRFEGDRAARASEIGPAELRQVARQFNQMAAALARREQDKQAFLAGVSHDLRNPLQALQLALGQLDPDGPLPSEGRIRKLLAMVTRQVSRLGRQLDDLTDSALADAGQLELRPEPAELRQLVRDVAELFAVASPSHCIELALPADPVLIHCDPGRIARVLTNLIQNAVKYSPHGGAIRVGLERGPDEVIVSVADEGIGIPRDEQAAVFDPYRRSPASSGRIPGAGLGLFVVRRIVEAHGGRVDVSSAPASGSTFRVTLPAHGAL